MDHEQPTTHLKERLPFPFGQLIQEVPPGGICQGLEYICHTPTIDKYSLVYQRFGNFS